ncbi:NADPH-dependent diflavin oxidoreductase 1 [Diutina catenulata]
MISILYGSETGNAQDYAEYVGVRLRYHGLSPTVSAMDDFPLESLITKTKYLIVVCSTTGQGALPRNARQLFQFLLRRDLPSDFLDHLQITSFGLGDSTYAKFNYASKKIHRRLVQLGATELSPRCEADEMGELGPDGFYKEWEAQLLAALSKKMVTKFDDSRPLVPQTRLVEADQPLEQAMDSLQINGSGSETSDLGLTRSMLLQGTVTKNQRATADDHFQDIRHVVIEADTALDYQAGDTCALYPSNDDQSVEDFLDAQPQLKKIADKQLNFEGDEPQVGGGLVQAPLTLRVLLKYHLDIWSIPKRAFFAQLWHFVDASTEDGERERDKLKEFGELEYPDEIYDYANRPRRSVLETIQEFSNNLTIPLEQVWQLFPKIRSRQFSIASAASGSKIELVIGIVEYRTILKRLRRGLCTKWLKSVNEGDRVVFSVVPMKLRFSLPECPNPPLIMAAPGTGIAPVRAIIQSVIPRDPSQRIELFYGCRYREKDFLFAQEWEKDAQQGAFTLHACFSRDKGYTPRYVQDGLWQHAEALGKLIKDEHAIFYVCGASGNMPKQVKITVVEIMKKVGVEEPEKYVQRLEEEGRYLEDVW